MHRIPVVIGQAADWGVFGVALGMAGMTFLNIPFFGMTLSDAGAVATGIGALLVGLGRALKYAADARISNAEARRQEIENKFRQHELWHKHDESDN